MRRMTILIKVLCLPVAFVTVAIGTQSSTAPVPPLLSSVGYHQILNDVFRYEGPNANQAQYSLLLRFMSSNHSESQVVIERDISGKSHAWVFTVSGPSVWTVANEYIQKAGREDTREIAKLLNATKSIVPISSSQAQMWHDDLLESLSRTSVELRRESTVFQQKGETVIVLDGSTYEFIFRQGTTEVHWETMDEEVNDGSSAGRTAIARTMNEIRRYALAHKAM